MQKQLNHTRKPVWRQTASIPLEKDRKNDCVCGLTDELGQQIKMETGYDKCFGGTAGGK